MMSISAQAQRCRFELQYGCSCHVLPDLNYRWEDNPPFTSLVLNSSAITINPNKHFTRILQNFCLLPLLFQL